MPVTDMKTAKATTVDEYLAALSPGKRSTLESARKVRGPPGVASTLLFGCGRQRPKNVMSQLIAGRIWPLLLIRPLWGSQVEPLTYPQSVMPRTFG